MLKMSDESRRFLEKYLPEALGAEEINDALDALYMWIDIHGFDAEEEYNELGKLGQEVYDDLYYNND